MTRAVPVRMVPDDTGQFPGRPVYSERDMDEACERIVADLLEERHGVIRYPIATDDLTVLMERDTEDLDLFADLDAHGGDIHGVTMFRAGRRPSVKISGKLTNDPYRINRFRSTLAHEYGHILLHAFLYEDGPPKAPSKSASQGGDWMEWQADYAAGALLMPRSALADTVREHRGNPTSPAPPKAESSPGRRMITAVSRGFAVSRAAARVRLEQQEHLARDRNRRR